jgi:hypothetical protein
MNFAQMSASLSLLFAIIALSRLKKTYVLSGFSDGLFSEKTAFIGRLDFFRL